jgi:hypothetical protein
MILQPKHSPVLDVFEAAAPGACWFGGGGGAPAGYSENDATTFCSEIGGPVGSTTEFLHARAAA